MKNSKKLVLLALVLILLASTLVAGAYAMKYARISGPVPHGRPG